MPPSDVTERPHDRPRLLSPPPLPSSDLRVHVSSCQRLNAFSTRPLPVTAGSCEGKAWGLGSTHHIVAHVTRPEPRFPYTASHRNTHKGGTHTSPHLRGPLLRHLCRRRPSGRRDLPRPPTHTATRNRTLAHIAGKAMLLRHPRSCTADTYDTRARGGGGSWRPARRHTPRATHTPAPTLSPMTCTLSLSSPGAGPRLSPRGRL